MPLSDLRIKALKPEAKAYKKADGEGLHIVVKPTGSKLWKLAYRFDDKQKTLSLGAYPTVGLVAARKKRTEAKEHLDNGVDPATVMGKAKQVARAQAKSGGETLNELFDEWYDKKKGPWGEAYRTRFLGRWRDHVRGTLGTVPLRQLTAKRIHDEMQVIEGKGLGETTHRILQNIGGVLRYGAALGRVDRDFTADLQGTLKPAPPVVHHPAIKRDELPNFFRRLDTVDAKEITKLAIRFTMHTMVRTNETIGLVPDELEPDFWRIPKERMKMKREHLVPYTPQVQAIIQRAREINPTGRLFPMSNNAMLYMTYRMGYAGKMTVHGFRSLASTMLNEWGFNRDWVEMQLAHTDNSVRGVYNAAEYLDGRREMLRRWSVYLEEVENKAVDRELEELLS